MQIVVTLFFYAHSALCAACAVYMLARVAALVPSGPRLLLDWRDLEVLDEWIVQLSGWTVLALYLVFTEVYLYRMHLGL